MLSVEALFEAHLAVGDLDVSIGFYRDVLGLELAHATADRRAAFFWLGGRGRTMLGIWAEPASTPTTAHVAFATRLDEVLAAPAMLRAAGITPLDFDGAPTDEAVVLCWMPAASVYFRDPDGHLLEYVAMLDETPDPDGGVMSWGSWRARRPQASLEFGTGSRIERRMPQYTIARARPHDVEHLAGIEREAARLLRGHAPESVLAETTGEHDFHSALQRGHLWVALADDSPVGFARVEPLDSSTLHLEEIDVLPAHGRRGLGTRLVDAVCVWAEINGFQAVTLTTFRDVPWNMPFYQRLGFRVVSPDELSAALRAIVEGEIRRGLDPARRVVMARACVTPLTATT